MLETLGFFDNVIHVALVGTVSSTTAPSNDPLKNLLGPTCYASLVTFDLGRATYIDSSGLGWLVACQKRFLLGGGKLVIHSVPPIVLQVLRLVKFDSVLTICADRPTAVARLTTPVEERP